jgi:hypothetical protein
MVRSRSSLAGQTSAAHLCPREGKPEPADQAAREGGVVLGDDDRDAPAPGEQEPGESGVEDVGVDHIGSEPRAPQAPQPKCEPPDSQRVGQGERQLGDLGSYRTEAVLIRFEDAQ